MVYSPPFMGLQKTLRHSNLPRYGSIDAVVVQHPVAQGAPDLVQAPIVANDSRYTYRAEIAATVCPNRPASISLSPDSQRAWIIRQLFPPAVATVAAEPPILNFQKLPNAFEKASLRHSLASAFAALASGTGI